MYLRAESNKSVVCTLLAAKARVAPIAGSTIPRLELLSAVILARLMASIQQALSKTFTITRSVCSLDSEITLWWITQPDKEFKAFVQNRVAEIRRLTPPEMWRHVPSEKNSAYLVSRGCNASRLKEDTEWWEGPSFLRKREEHWPTQKQFRVSKFEDTKVKKVSHRRR